MNEKEIAEFVQRFEALPKWDSEDAHVEADKILLEALRAAGAGPIADAWESAQKEIGFWYA